jgi:superoxide dismutase, Cu-Zn family
MTRLSLGLLGASLLCIATGASAAETAIKVSVNSISAEGIGKQVGTLTIAAVNGGGVSFTPDLRGFGQGSHAFHVHEKPDCGPGASNGQKVAGLAAGAHYNRAGSHGATPGHGQMAMAMRGDLPELTATPDGRMTKAVVKKDLTLAELHGRSVMIHEYGEQPPDPAKPKGGGARVACAVIP